MNKIKIIILTFIFSSLFFSCTENDNTTVVLLGKETYLKKMTEVIPDSLIGVFENYFGTIPSGYIPPNIEGEYIVSPKRRIFSNVSQDNWPLDIVEPDFSMTLSRQHNRECIMQLNEASSTLTDTVYISGYDNMFSVYYTEDKTLQHSGYEHNITRNIIVKGEITDYGIKDLKIASIIVKAYDNSNGNIIQYKSGDFFLYEDGDKFSEKVY